jgi:hypothetical protein
MLSAKHRAKGIFKNTRQQAEHGASVMHQLCGRISIIRSSNMIVLDLSHENLLGCAYQAGRLPTIQQPEEPGSC